LRNSGREKTDFQSYRIPGSDGLESDRVSSRKILDSARRRQMGGRTAPTGTGFAQEKSGFFSAEKGEK